MAPTMPDVPDPTGTTPDTIVGPAPRTVGAALDRLRADFAACGIETADIDARRLVASASAMSTAELIAAPERGLSAEQWQRLDAYRRRRLAREPVSRILGRRGFWKGTFEINPAVLDPRPESETLISAAAELIATNGRSGAALTIADLGTGSGALLASLLGEFANARGVATDISLEALALARRNCDALGVGARARFVQTSWLGGITARFDLIVTNPPYVASGDIVGLAPEVARHDPRGALDGGVDGLSAYREISQLLARSLAPGGLVLMEIGAGQEPAVAAILAGVGIEVFARASTILRDLSGRERCVAASDGSGMQKKLLETEDVRARVLRTESSKAHQERRF